MQSVALIQQFGKYLADHEPGKSEVKIFYNGKRYKGGALTFTTKSSEQMCEEVEKLVQNLGLTLKPAKPLKLNLTRKVRESTLQKTLNALSKKGKATDSSASTQAPDFLFPRMFTEQQVGFSRSARPDWRSVVLQLFMEIGGNAK
jgi:hypothetical protein